MAPHISGLRRAEYSTAAHLLAYGLAIALPLLVLLGFLLYRSVALERAELENRILQLVVDLADDIDRDLNGHLALLQSLAASPFLAEGDWPAFHAQAKAALDGRAYLVLVDPSGRQIVNTYVPFGQAPPFTGDPETVRQVVEQKRPAVSNLFISLVTKTPVFNVSMPIARNGTVRYVMSLGLLPSDLLTILRGQALEPGWVSTLWDRTGTILARSRDHERYVGTQLPARLQGERSGVYQAVNIDGESVLRATASSKLSNWSVAVNAPVTLVEQQLRRSLWVWAGTALAAGVLAVGLGLLFGRGLAQPLSFAATAATLLGRGQPIDAWRSRVKEANRFIEALLAAQKTIDDRTSELRDSERQLRTAADAAQFGAHEFDAASNRVRWSPQLRQLLGLQQDLEDPVTLDTALSFVHPDDRQRVHS